MNESYFFMTFNTVYSPTSPMLNTKIVRHKNTLLE